LEHCPKPNTFFPNPSIIKTHNAAVDSEAGSHPPTYGRCSVT
jgi:hypothetical protein